MTTETIRATVSRTNRIGAAVRQVGQVSATVSRAAVAGARDYDLLLHKPSINGVTVQGDKTAHDYGLENEGVELTRTALYELFASVFNN